MKEELYRWYPIVDEGEYWLYSDTNTEDTSKIRTVVTNGKILWTYYECRLGWGTMAKQGNWKYMRIKIDQGYEE